MNAAQKTGKPLKLVTILVNNRAVEIAGREPSGAEIKAAAQVPAEFKLYDAKGAEIADEARLKVHEKERFTAISGQDVS